MTSSTFVAEARDHDKCVKAGNEAAAFWMWAIQWSNKKQTDGFLDDALLHTIPPKAIHPRKAKALAELCAGAFIKRGGAVLFERVEGGYLIHDFHDHRTPERTPETDLLHEQLVSTARSEAGRIGASKRWQSEMAKHGHANGNAIAGQMALPVAIADALPDGSRALSPSGFSGSDLSESALDPLESLPDPEGDSHHARSKRRTAIREDWTLTEADIQHASDRGWTQDRIAEEADKFRDFHLARRTLSASWAASWRTWVANAKRFDAQRGSARPGPARSTQPAATTQFKPAQVLR